MNRPRIRIDLGNSENKFLPGEVLVSEYYVALPSDHVATAVESSVIWTTSGKGEQDVGVHFFERRPKQTLNADQLKRPHRISTVLPQSPLSYEGAIIQIRWAIRLRVFSNNQQFAEDLFFQLGEVSSQDSQDSETTSK